MRTALQICRDFYDNYGWKRDPATGRFLAELVHEDLDPSVQEYMRACEARYQDAFAAGGKFFLDAGCGGEPRTEMSARFEKHVCVDVSIEGLKEARGSLGEKGLCVVADLSALPFRKDAFAGSLASHVLYHIEPEEQARVVDELYRVTEPQKPLLIFYVCPRSLFTIFEHVNGRLNHILSRFRAREASAGNAVSPPVTRPGSFAQSPKALVRKYPWTDLTCLRTLSIFHTRPLRKLGLLRAALPIFKSLEKAFPHAMVHVGRYVALLIQKRDSS